MKRFPFLSSITGLGAVCVGAIWLLKDSQAAGQGASVGITTCINTLIPSLFPFMVLCTYVVESGLSNRLGRYAGGVTRFLFRLPGCTAPVILLSFLGGYPAGAKGISQLLARKEITTDEAGQMLCFCVNAGPPFVLTAVGSCLLGDFTAGVVLLLSTTLSGLLLGIIFRFFSSSSSVSKPHCPPPASASSPFVSSVTGASRSLLTLCAFVILFSVILSLMRESGLFSILTRRLLLLGMSPGNAASLPSLLAEVTAGCRDGAMFGASMPMIAFGLGWGGLCVHLQIFSFFPQFPLARWKFWFSRLLHGILSAVFTWNLLPFFPQVRSASALWSSQVTGGLAASVPAVLTLFLLFLVMALDGTRFSPFDRQKTGT